ncbi:bcl-2-like protein 11 isoform X2 [Polypterus senegalus]|uniref:bcl-2-like protein 11 isoform X2 n=1 Tax=Polypterus senegalus TaxID=55291 RepID=UPI001962A235|nr:bcl-2-like protein 11 isoform X2 [Polypterus senegalus]
MARPPSDLNSESGAGDGGPLQPTQGAGRPLSRPGPRTHSEGDQSGEVSQPAPNSLQGGLAMPPSPHPYASRFPLFSYFSRSSSGYYSFESGSVSSLPSMTDKFTQTPSLSSQAIRHAQQWLAQEYEHYQGHDMPQASSGPTRARRSSMPEEMRPEEMVAQELRRIGDDFNYLYFQRGIGGRNNEAEASRLRWVIVFVWRLFDILTRWR